MPKASAKKIGNKPSKEMRSIADGNESVRLKPCEEPFGVTPDVTASIRKNLGNFDPGFGKIGGRTNIGNGLEAYLRETLEEEITMDFLNMSVDFIPSTRQNGT